MRESDNEILARAYETLERANRTLDQQQRAPVEDVYAAAAKWDLANPKKLTVATMTQREFAAWHAAGKPPLVEKSLPRPQPRNNAMDPDQVRKYVSDRLVEFAELIGEETGKNEKALRTEIDALHAEIRELQRGERSADAVELPDWPYAAATH